MGAHSGSRLESANISQIFSGVAFMTIRFVPWGALCFLLRKGQIEWGIGCFLQSISHNLVFYK